MSDDFGGVRDVPPGQTPDTPQDSAGEGDVDLSGVDLTKLPQFREYQSKEHQRMSAMERENAELQRTLTETKTAAEASLAQTQALMEQLDAIFENDPDMHQQIAQAARQAETQSELERLRRERDSASQQAEYMRQAQDWYDYYKGQAAKFGVSPNDPEFVTALNSHDNDTVTTALIRLAAKAQSGAPAQPPARTDSEVLREKAQRGDFTVLPEGGAKMPASAQAEEQLVRFQAEMKELRKRGGSVREKMILRKKYGIPD